jgi:micrococcal nuclease
MRFSRLALILLLILLTACGSHDPTPTGAGEYAQVATVVDGDTITLTDGRRVRYIGINTPEVDQPYATEATAFNESLVAGPEIWLETDAQVADQYGRLLAYVWVNDTFINLELVRQGYANAYSVPPNVRYADVFVQAEREACEAERGLWKSTDGTDAAIRITALAYDAPGSDSANPNGEWIELSNAGDAPVDLSGYLLKDAGPHAYVFGPVALAPGARVRIYSGQGTDTERELYWGLVEDAVWNNDGDVAYLYDDTGAFVDSYSYTP